MNELDHSIHKFNNYSFSYTKPVDMHSLGNYRKRGNYHLEEEDYQKATDRKLAKSKELRDKLYQEKREMQGRAPGQNSKSSPANNMSFFLRQI